MSSLLNEVPAGRGSFGEHYYEPTARAGYGFLAGQKTVRRFSTEER